jgi:hypothetical protein
LENQPLDPTTEMLNALVCNPLDSSSTSPLSLPQGPSAMSIASSKRMISLNREGKTAANSVFERQQ